MGPLADFAIRYALFAALVLLTAASAILSAESAGWLIPLAVGGALSLLGVWDMVQTRHTLMRNYPVIAYVRWIMEALRPYLRQYIVESDLSGRPIPRESRRIVYARAKGQEGVHPFGTELDTYSSEYEFLCHSVAPAAKATEPFRVTIGGPQCEHPYSASILNVSAMSFGSLGQRAVETLNLAAARGGFYQDTGEGGVSPYHLKHGGDLVWEIGTGYFGCRNRDGTFDPGAFSEMARDERIRMVELKLSQGAKPGHGGILPGAKVTPEIARARDVAQGEDCISPSAHSAFSTPVGLMEFIARMRELSGGKPAGFKLCVGHAGEVMAICKAIRETGIKPDFIVVDGGEGGTGAAPQEFTDKVGMPLREGLILVRNALVGTRLDEHVRIGAAGKITDAATMAAALAVGADWCNAARAFMFSIGCVMSMKCHTDRCPTGVTTHNPNRQRGLVVEDKARRAQSYHARTVAALADLVSAAGLQHPAELSPHMLYHRVSPVEARRMDQIYAFLEPGALLEDPDSTPFGRLWHGASAQNFAPVRH